VKNATLVNEGRTQRVSLLIRNGLIDKILYDNLDGIATYKPERVIDAGGKWLLPGVIDDQVHFREPGLTHKGDIYTESKAAIAGGVTSYMEMPNTTPQPPTLELLDEKFRIASEKSLANYSFYLGATNNNIDQIAKADPRWTCGVKVFMGSSTGNMLVDNRESLDRIFKLSPILIATHCEDEATIRRNIEAYREQYGDNVEFKHHAFIRSEEACYLSSELAVSLARAHGSRLHLLHLSTGKELALLDNTIPLINKKITGEVCVHHLWFNFSDYERLGWRIKWNPSIKTERDRLALIDGLKTNRLDVVATDHAPHLISEKDSTYLKSASGGPMVQHSLTAMLELARQGFFSIETVVDKMCHAPAVLFGIEKRGFVREGYHADLVLVDPSSPSEVHTSNILYKCGWSPLEGVRLSARVTHTFVNGRLVYENGKFDESVKGQALSFAR